MDNIINNNDMDKEQLETNLAALKLLQQETNDKLTDHKSQIALLEKQLADINKPAITPAMMEQIEGAIETAVGDFDFSDDDNFEKEFEIENENDLKKILKVKDNPSDNSSSNGSSLEDLIKERIK